MAEVPYQEWLVTDQRGGFAMGSTTGARERKYHGYYLGIAGRDETCFLGDFELEPDGDPAALFWPRNFSYARRRPQGPLWRCDHENGVLLFGVSALDGGGIQLEWSWSSPSGKPIGLGIRPFFAMRRLHGMEGLEWNLELEGDAGALVTASSGARAYLGFSTNLRWQADRTLNRKFRYSEESRRGYLDEESLFAAGRFEVLLEEDSSARIELHSQHRGNAAPSIAPIPAMDFVLKEPAGIVAGFPWFGEWGRDTFVSLPGIAMSWIHGGGNAAEVHAWTEEILEAWGAWVHSAGMLPNLVERDGSHQWESADATLWWCHSLASLWAFSLNGEGASVPDVWRPRYSKTLAAVIHSISTGRHPFLRLRADGLLDVTEGHASWMDARIEGAPVTPRTGPLPEINALWFQAQCLQALWSDEPMPPRLQDLARQALEVCQEPERPNRIFLHSIPLAPSFVLGALSHGERVRADEEVERIARELGTPFGLRTLKPGAPSYRPRCEGSQHERDLSYHQGPVWAWLGGHFEMARKRMAPHSQKEVKLLMDEALTEEWRKSLGSIEGHIAEVFDAEFPLTPRGAPAQAWSLACIEEARARRRNRTDHKLTKVLARRWRIP